MHSSRPNAAPQKKTPQTQMAGVSNVQPCLGTTGLQRFKRLAEGHQLINGKMKGPFEYETCTFSNMPGCLSSSCWENCKICTKWSPWTLLQGNSDLRRKHDVSKGQISVNLCGVACEFSKSLGATELANQMRLLGFGCPI